MGQHTVTTLTDCNKSIAEYELRDRTIPEQSSAANLPSPNSPNGLRNNRSHAVRLIKLEACAYQSRV